ncbi:MAG: winged helix-turn-helix domain-containing protein [Anaerolineaceae bacterium]|nr:winged helix-turn-helix domain-containing protein [Anaerolineaceae bacterium]
MEDQYYFKNIEQIQAIAEPTRWRILSLLIAQPMTGSQLARALGIPGPLAHYHLKILEKVELVEFQEEQTTGSMVEKYYRAIARDYRTDHLVDSFRSGENNSGNEDQTAEFVRDMMETMLMVARMDLASMEARPVLAKTGFNFQDEILLTQAQTNDFIAELRKLAERFQKLASENRLKAESGTAGDINHLRFTWLLTPVAPLPAVTDSKVYRKKKMLKDKKE